MSRLASRGRPLLCYRVLTGRKVEINTFAWYKLQTDRRGHKAHTAVTGNCVVPKPNKRYMRPDFREDVAHACPEAWPLYLSTIYQLDDGGFPPAISETIFSLINGSTSGDGKEHRYACTNSRKLRQVHCVDDFSQSTL